LNLNQKKCKFLYDAQNALRADSENISPCSGTGSLRA
jgi:hypothetical protein